MSQSTNPLIKRLMSRGTQSFNRAKTKKDPLGALKCPDGFYYCQVKAVRFVEIGKAGTQKDPAVEIRSVIICHAGDDQYAAGDMSFAGEQPRILFTFKASAKRTEEEAWESFMYALQGFGYDTTMLIMDESERTNTEEFTLEALLQHLAQEMPFIKILIKQSDNSQYRNVNFRGLVSGEELQQLIGQDPTSLAASIPDAPVDDQVYDYAVEGGQAPDLGVATAADIAANDQMQNQPLGDLPSDNVGPDGNYLPYGTVYQQLGDGSYIYHDGYGGYVNLDGQPVNTDGYVIAYQELPQPPFDNVPPAPASVPAPPVPAGRPAPPVPPAPPAPAMTRTTTPPAPPSRSAAPATPPAPPSRSAAPATPPAPPSRSAAPATPPARPATPQPPAIAAAATPTMQVQRPAVTTPANPQPLQRPNPPAPGARAVTPPPPPQR